MIGFVVKLFFITIAVSVMLSMALGWFALMRARIHLGKVFTRPEQPPRADKNANVIEGEYRVLGEDEKH